MQRLVRAIALSGFWLTLAGAGRAEIVVLDNGRFLKAESFRVEGEQARVALPNGGELVLPIVRIERVLEDEVSSRTSRQEAPAPLDPPVSVYLGFEPEQGAPETPYGDFIFAMAERHNVNPNLVAAIVRAESGFDPNAISRNGALGLMQLMPSTGKRLGATRNELLDAEINIATGVRYLGQLIDFYGDDLALVLAAYKAGEAAVERHGGVPPLRETREFISRVYSYLGNDAE